MPKSMEEVIRELQDTATVMAGIQARQAEALKAHSLWLQEHDRTMAELRDRDKTFAAGLESLKERIEALVSGFGKFIADRQ
jgi:hypothetical protein